MMCAFKIKVLLQKKLNAFTNEIFIKKLISNVFQIIQSLMVVICQFYNLGL